jgi:methionyl-tRNA formyltransferase
VKDIRIVFMGTPEFAVDSLKAIISKGFEVCAVITSPDRPAGRGQKLRQSAVKQLALSKGLKIIQPENLKDAEFLEQLEALHATLFVVVAFRMLPDVVWTMPSLGTFNLHASLLPQYRGAAPINRMVMNGEKKGGVTTFFLRHAIDTGNIIFREETTIGEHETAGELHNRLKEIGAGLVVRTIETIRDGTVSETDQAAFLKAGEVLRTAPKIKKEDCRIDWQQDAEQIYNQIRGLSPYPGAFAELTTNSGEILYLKIYRAEIEACNQNVTPGTILTDHKNYLKIRCRDACVAIDELQQAGKKKMKIHDFLIGLKDNVLG